jgi:hypothetical protein
MKENLFIFPFCFLGTMLKLPSASENPTNQEEKSVNFILLFFIFYFLLTKRYCISYTANYIAKIKYGTPRAL